MERDQREKAVIVGSEEDGSLDELAALVESAGGRVMARMVLRRAQPDPAFFLTAGKLGELKGLVSTEGAVLVVFDDELSPVQARNLEEELAVKIIDRTELILDIFAQRARTKEAKLQVEKGQLEYLLPRLTGKGVILSRLAGGIGTRGPGETKLEADRQRIRARIAVLNRRLRQVKANRRYGGHPPPPLWPSWRWSATPCRKSTLFRLLTGADVGVEDRLLLDPTIRRLTFPNQLETLIIDTVGLIRKLPHQLVEAFRATLEELYEADLLIHVVNLASPYRDEEYMAGRQLLRELGLEDKPSITVLNKVDLVENEFTVFRAVRTYPQAVAISARTGAGVEELKDKVVAMLSAHVDRGAFFIPFTEGGYLSLLHEKGKVYTQEYRDSGVYLEVELPRVWAERLRQFRVSGD